MSILADWIRDNGGTYAIGGKADLEELRDKTFDATYEAADARCIYWADCLDALERHAEFEPDPAELRERLDPNELANWRGTMTLAACLATQGYLAEQLEADLARVESAIVESEANGFTVTAIESACRHGWQVHQHEAAWSSGALLTWQKLEGGADANLLRVALGDGTVVWLVLDRP